MAPYNFLSVNSINDRIDLNLTTDVEMCRQEKYCTCLPGGVQCEGQPDNTPVLTVNVGVHPKVNMHNVTF